MDRVYLRRLTVVESKALTAGHWRPADGLRWDPDYPTTDTFVALGLLRLAYDAAGPSPPGWWVYQIVVGSTWDGVGDDVVVATSAPGPPEPGPAGRGGDRATP